MKESYSNQEKFISSLLIFVFIFIIIVIAVLAVHYSGILNLKNESSITSLTDSASESFATYPSDFSSTDPLQTASQSSEQTTESTKYLPATVPTYIPPNSTSTTKTTESKNTEQTTKSSQTTETTQTQETPPADQPQGGITAEDITDEKMEELITVKYLDIRPSYSRRGPTHKRGKLLSVDNIVVHYVANENTPAKNNWNYFNTQTKTAVSAHFIIDMDGSIIQCLPLDEVAYAVGTETGNRTSISIECCHPDETGVFTDETYESLVKLVSWLCAKFDLTEENVKRHYDYPQTNSSGYVWHKQCPKYFVDHPEEWEAFKEDLYID